MMRFGMAFAVILTYVATAFGQVTVVQNPSPQTSFVEAAVKLEAGQAVTWFISPTPEKQVELENTLYFNGPAGTYSVTALILTLKDGKIVPKKTTLNVVIGSPTPPKPVDPVVPDVSQFTRDIQAAFTAESDPSKATNTSKLASLYRMAAKSTVNDASISTVGQLFDALTSASRTLLPANGIPAVRKVIGTRLNPQFGSASTPLDAITRTRLISEFTAIADALAAAK